MCSPFLFQLPFKSLAVLPKAIGVRRLLRMRPAVQERAFSRRSSSKRTTPPARGGNRSLLYMRATALNQYGQHDHKQHAGDNPDHCDVVHFSVSFLLFE
jgi:hypothetical protein